MKNHGVHIQKGNGNGNRTDTYGRVARDRNEMGAGTARLAASTADTPAVERAMAFGAQQLIAQHSGLWDLMAARAASRAFP